MSARATTGTQCHGINAHVRKDGFNLLLFKFKPDFFGSMSVTGAVEENDEEGRLRADAVSKLHNRTKREESEGAENELAEKNGPSVRKSGVSRLGSCITDGATAERITSTVDEKHSRGGICQ